MTPIASSPSFLSTPIEHDPRLVRLYLRQTCLRLYACMLPLLLIVMGLMLTLVAYLLYRGGAGMAWLQLVYGLFALLLPLVLANSMARQQLRKFADEGVALSEELISAQVRRELVSPFDIFSSFDLCAEALSGLGTGQALGLSGPPAFAHDPFKRIIVVGRLRPFRLFGATEVRLWAEEEGVRIRVRRIVSAHFLVMQTGGALRAVAAVTAQLQSCLLRRQRAQEAAVREQLVERNALQARLSALQAQVEPHFLFNTLANLKYLQRTDTLAAQDMLDHLIGYLQNALPDMRAVSSTLGRELDLARDYLSIMQIRMGERLRFAIEAPDHLRDAPMPPAMLISLVENALRHGLQGLPRPGFVRIVAMQEGGRLRLCVQDDGAGFGDAASFGHGLGLSNIQARLALLYGDQAALEVLPQEPAGVSAILRLPLPATQEPA